jgi:hypothetical protein
VTIPRYEAFLLKGDCDRGKDVKGMSVVSPSRLVGDRGCGCGVVVFMVVVVVVVVDI